jgi:hypothetical protein
VRQRLRVGNLIELLKGGQEVSLRDFKNAVGEEGYAEYEQRLVHRRHEIEAMTSLEGSSGYDEWLKKGLLAYGKGTNSRGKKSSKYFNEAEKCFERATEQLQSDYHANPSISVAYDRPIADFDFSLDPVGMPRRITSKSLDNVSAIDWTINKAKLKLEVLETVYARLLDEEGKEGKEKGRKVAEARGRKRKKNDWELLQERLNGGTGAKRTSSKSDGSARLKGKKVVEGITRKEGEGKVASDNVRVGKNADAAKLEELFAVIRARKGR